MSFDSVHRWLFLLSFWTINNEQDIHKVRDERAKIPQRIYRVTSCISFSAIIRCCLRYRFWSDINGIFKIIYCVIIGLTISHCSIPGSQYALMFTSFDGTIFSMIITTYLFHVFLGFIFGRWYWVSLIWMPVSWLL